VREQAGELLDGGTDALEARLDELRGHPVVVNKWASWCGPCRAEFPYFQGLAIDRGDEIAFLGIDSDDSEDAARTFLEELPLPYPSYSDPDKAIAASLDAEREFPATVFIDAAGEQVFVHRGAYASEDALVADIERYAR
jgi:cytochrome c biogenesis protein CcmG/thiol:disulfide interchange protein DsbE